MYTSGDEAFLVPAGPHTSTTRKHKAGSITSSCLGKEGKWSELHSTYVLQPSLGSGIATHKDYPCSSLCQHSAQLPFTVLLKEAGAS